MFDITDEKIDTDSLKQSLAVPENGAFVCFEGWVRNHHEGREVRSLSYTAYRELALKEGQRIISESLEKWPGASITCVHRIGPLQIGDLAVWVGVSTPHRDDAFAACRHLIDEVKARVPIWKEEFHPNGHSEWLTP